MEKHFAPGLPPLHQVMSSDIEFHRYIARIIVEQSR